VAQATRFSFIRYLTGEVTLAPFSLNLDDEACLAADSSSPYYPLTVKLSLCGPYLLNLKFEVGSVLRGSGGSLP
jgi:hypothetical protein